MLPKKLKTNSEKSRKKSLNNIFKIKNTTVIKRDVVSEGLVLERNNNLGRTSIAFVFTNALGSHQTH